MSKIWAGVATCVAAIILVGVLFWRHSSSQLKLTPLPNGDTAKSTLTAPPEPLTTSNAGATKSTAALPPRPAPAVTARNVHRCGIGAALAPMGASPALLDRFSNGDFAEAFSQLKDKARGGDLSAANQLDYIAHFTCAFATVKSSNDSSDSTDSNRLPPEDRDWFRSFLEQRNSFKQQLANSCQESLDKSEIDTWVTNAAAKGDPASEYSLWMFGGTNIRRRDAAYLRASALAGYPWGQFSLVGATNSSNPGVVTGGEPSDHPGDMLRAAALSIPAAESQLAKCEFVGCEYIPQDIPAAIVDARTAAQEGSMDAIFSIGPQLTPSQIDPDEVQAWKMIDASLRLQGYQGNLSVQALESATALINSSSLNPKARTLAEQYWQRYGAKILTGLGCTG